MPTYLLHTISMISSNFELSWGSIWRILLLGVAAVIFYLTLDIWVAVFLAIVISSGLNPLVNLLERWKIPRAIGTITAFILIIAVFSSALYVIIPEVISQTQILLERYFDVIARYLNIDVVKQSNIFDVIVGQLQSFSVISSGTNGAFEFSKNLFGNIALAIAAFAIAFYLTVDNKGIEKFIKAVIPNPYEDKVNNIINRARRKIGYWVQAQIGLSFFIGSLTFIGLYIIGYVTHAEILMSNALVLGLLAATFEIIPFVGPFFSGAMAVIIAFSAAVPSPGLLALYVVIFFVAIQQIEGDLLVPTLMNRAVGLHPVAVLVSLLIGAQLFGFVGIFLAVPASVVIQEFVEDWSSKKGRYHRLV